MTRMETSDPAFEAWLQALPALGYDRHWVRRNIAVLRKRYVESGGAAMPPCPPPTAKRYDPYRDI